MDRFKFGDINQLNDHSCMWKLAISTDSTIYERTSTFQYENRFWSVALYQIHDSFAEYMMNCSVMAPPDQKGVSPLFQLFFRLSIVDDSSREMWSSKTVQGSFAAHRSFYSRSLFLPVPSSIMSDVNDRSKTGKECFLKLDFIKEKSKREAADSERATGPELEYKGTGALLEAVKELLLDEEDFDVTFSVQGREFKAHKIILKVRSPVFKRMFAHDMLEKKSGRVEIEDCDPDVFALFHKFLYTGKADGLTEKSVAPLYHFADMYDVPSLCRMCVLFIENNFDVEEFGDFAEIACLNKEEEEDFFASTVEFMADKFQEIAKTVKWKQFMRKNTEWANELYQEVHLLYQ